MVGTGRIELPTSSVSRKRSPTELRACKAFRIGPLAAKTANASGIVLFTSKALFGNPLGRWRGPRLGSHLMMQEIEFITNSNPLCQPGGVMEGARFCSHMSPR